jgi:hypothetical protein
MKNQVENVTYGKVQSGEKSGSATAVQLPDIPCRAVAIGALSDNAGSVWIGGAGVTVADGTTDTTSGLQLQPGEVMQFVPVANLNVFYIICDNAGDDITYLALS